LQMSESKVWGKLISLNPNHPHVDISEDAVIGRNSDCTISFPQDQHISGKHCRIHKEDGVIFVEDFSSNGTFINGQKIGKGAFSVVYEGTERGTGEKYAIKCINKKFIKKKLLEREIEIMTTIRHENILFCKAVFESDNFIYLILELVKGGELYDKIVDEGEYTEEEAVPIVLQIINAVEYLHENGIAHRDLKPENILCGVVPNNTSASTGSSGRRTRREQIKVADFGLSKMFFSGRSDLQMRFSYICRS